MASNRIREGVHRLKNSTANTIEPALYTHAYENISRHFRVMDVKRAHFSVKKGGTTESRPRPLLDGEVCFFLLKRNDI
ncbi:hypothetical protein BTO28_09565 [Domibacillus epiphyticus]|uniref:Uncharacterized protein n=1 Tax=Domibacillus epiphyticus TaxID=1714355 RepID=A0A1V2A7Y5_9BACI|nr:hypothetical protein BTO28_09565 [Domibacillus epiphyticus]